MVANKTVADPSCRLSQLRHWQTALDIISNENKKEIDRLIITSTSLLLSLPDDILSHVVIHLDGEALLALEESSPRFKRSISLPQWDRLKKQRQSKFGHGNTRNAGIRFARASRFARRMEGSGKLHYDPCNVRCDYEWPTSHYTFADLCETIGGPKAALEAVLEGGVSAEAGDRACGTWTPRCDFFLRVSLGSNHLVLWEGFTFGKDLVAQNVVDEDDNIIIVNDADTIGVEKYAYIKLHVPRRAEVTHDNLNAELFVTVVAYSENMRWGADKCKLVVTSKRPKNLPFRQRLAEAETNRSKYLPLRQRLAEAETDSDQNLDTLPYVDVAWEDNCVLNQTKVCVRWTGRPKRSKWESMLPGISVKGLFRI